MALPLLALALSAAACGQSNKPTGSSNNNNNNNNTCDAAIDPSCETPCDPATDPACDTTPDPTCDTLDCTHLDNACQFGICDTATVTCVTSPLVASTSCGEAAAGDCNLADSCDGAGGCSTNVLPYGAPCNDCPAGAGNCGGCNNGSCEDRCGNGQIETADGEECDTANDSSCPGRCLSDCTCLHRNCLDILDVNPTAASGPHTITPVAGGPSTDVYCDMSSDEGGWLLLGTISGADADSWNTLGGLWSDSNTIGDPNTPWLDYKAAAWNDLALDGSEVLLQRRFSGATVAQVALDNSCLAGAVHFADLFQTWNTALACTPAQMRVIASDAAGLAAATYQEGGSTPGDAGLAGVGSNGLCWMGEDTDVDTFKGYLVWNDVTASVDCSQASHVGGIGVYESAGAPITTADITETAWLAGTDPTLTDISIFVRDKGARCRSDADCEALFGGGYLCDGASRLCYTPGSCDSSDPQVAPCIGPSTCMDGALGGMSCQGCTADSDCRVGESCLDAIIPGLGIGCMAGSFGGGLPI